MKNETNKQSKEIRDYNESVRAKFADTPADQGIRAAIEEDEQRYHRDGQLR